MRTFIVLVLSCCSVMAEDTGISVTSTSRTNAETGAIITEDTYTRNGQTNLVRVTKTENGMVTFRIQRFCHGKEFAYFSERPPNTPLSFTVKAKCPYEVTLDYLPGNRDARAVIVFGGTFFDGFYPTNGIYYPVANSELEMKDYK